MIKQAIAAMLLVGVLAGCNTVKGAGRDLESVGDAGQNAIDKAK